jgi:hypothetical protein
MKWNEVEDRDTGGVRLLGYETHRSLAGCSAAIPAALPPDDSWTLIGASIKKSRRGARWDLTLRYAKKGIRKNPEEK